MYNARPLEGKEAGIKGMNVDGFLEVEIKVFYFN